MIALTLVDRGVALGDERQVDDRHVDGRHADREAVELAVQLRQHQADRGGGAGLGRDHAHASPSARGAGPRDRRRSAPGRWCRRGSVVIRPFTMPILSCSALTSGARQLVVHEALEMTVSRRLQHVVVDAVDDGRVDVLAARRRDDHLLRAALAGARDAFSLVVKKPVHSSTTSTPSSPHGSFGRIALARARGCVSPLTIIVVAVDRRPCPGTCRARCRTASGGRWSRRRRGR